MHETSAAPPLAWSCAFPATPAQAREARRSLARILDGHPAAEDAVLCLSELAANATIHSRSRNGGHFTVRTQFGEGCVRVEVRDQGGPWQQTAPGGDEHGRGLLIVASLARTWGITGDGDTGWTVWAVIDAPGPRETGAARNGR